MNYIVVNLKATELCILKEMWEAVVDVMIAICVTVC